ncbi:hypothetical protein GCM10023065_31260 [Microbacterium laevaniformans]
MASATVFGTLDDAARRRIADTGLDLSPVSLQQLIVRLTMHTAPTSKELVS